MTVSNLAALAAMGVLAYCTLHLWVTNSDFFHHWGAKGQRFYLARGIDFGFLRKPWNGALNAWYPTMLPELFALTAIPQGAFLERAMMPWSLLGIAGLVAAGRELVHNQTNSGSLLGWFTAAFSAYCVALTILLRLAGGADLLIALGVTVASVELAKNSISSHDATIAVAAAFVAAAKVEGVVLAATILSTHQVRVGRAGLFSMRRAVLLVMPATLVVSIWWLQNHFYGLQPSAISGGLTSPTIPRIVGVIRSVVGEFMRLPLGGLAFIALVIPIAVLLRRARPAGLVATVGLSFYLWVYCVSASDPAVYVRTSFSRLLFHLVPAALASVVAALGTDEPEPSLAIFPDEQAGATN